MKTHLSPLQVNNTSLMIFIFATTLYTIFIKIKINIHVFSVFLNSNTSKTFHSYEPSVFYTNTLISKFFKVPKTNGI